MEPPVSVQGDAWADGPQDLVSPLCQALRVPHVAAMPGPCEEAGACSLLEMAKSWLTEQSLHGASELLGWPQSVHCAV